MRILLTGGSSDIGLRLVKKIISGIDKFDEIILIYNTNTAITELNSEGNKKIKLMNLNLLNEFDKEFKQILSKVDILIHLAWIRPKNPSKSFSANLDVANKILEYLNKNVKVIFLSSVAGVPHSASHYGKSKFEISKLLYSRCDTCIFVCGLIISDSKNSPFYLLKIFFEKKRLPIKFGNKIKILYINADNVVNTIHDKIFNFKKGIIGLYNKEEILLDSFIKEKFNLRRKIYINIGLLLNLFLLISQYVNNIPFVNRLSDKLTTLITNNKLKTDEFIKKEF